MKAWLKGGLIGLLISLLIVLFIVSASVNNYHERQQFYYERFLLCEPCGEPRDLDCVVEICEQEENKIYYRDRFDLHMSLDEYVRRRCAEDIDITGGHPEAFINGFCGYELHAEFGYGTKPSKIKIFFSPRVIKESLGMTLFAFPPLGILILLMPFIGVIIGWLIGRRR